MAETEQTGVTEAVPEPETNNQAAPVAEATQESSGPSAEGQEQNWREARAIMKELQDRNRALEEQVATITAPPVEEEENLGDDDIPTVKFVKQQNKRNYEKARKDALKEFRAETAEDRLLDKCPDWKTVCSHENIKKLNQRFPDLAKSLASNSDVFSQGKAAYDMISTLGIANVDTKQNREKMQQNSLKPQMAMGGKPGALDSAHLFESGQKPNLTKSLSSQLWQETQDAAKGF